jgi:arylformamidase
VSAVYRNFTQADLDSEYSPATAAVDLPGRFRGWQSRSAAARRELRCACDIPYGRSGGETLDIFFAARNSAPIQVFFHGGYWRSQDKANFSFMAESFVKAGAHVVIPNYDLCPAVTIDEIVRQSASAVAWTYRNARIFGGDPNAISIYGHSAGGHIVAALLATDWSAFGAPDSTVKSVAALSGLFDLEPLRLSYLNADLRMDAATALRNSPKYQMARSRVPMLIAVGGKESSEFKRQSQDYVDTLAGRSYVATMETVPGVDHYEILEAAIDPSNSLGRALSELLFPSTPT